MQEGAATDPQVVSFGCLLLINMARTLSSPAKRIGPILLVDDYDDARASVREVLENAGYSVVEAVHGQQALEYLANQTGERVALILLDLQMPVMDGWRLLELMSCYIGLATIPVIIVTAMEPRLERLSHPSVYAYVQSPYAIEDLLDLVDLCLSGGRVPLTPLINPRNQTG